MRHIQGSLVLVAALALPPPLLAQTCPNFANPPCNEPIDICPIPLLRVHVDFPVYDGAKTNWHSCPGTKRWEVLEGPSEFTIDNAAGLFYWTPASIPSPDGVENITIRIRNTTR